MIAIPIHRNSGSSLIILIVLLPSILSLPLVYQEWQLSRLKISYVSNIGENFVVCNNVLYLLAKKGNNLNVLHNDKVVHNKEVLACVFTTDLIVKLAKYVYYASNAEKLVENIIKTVTDNDLLSKIIDKKTIKNLKKIQTTLSEISLNNVKDHAYKLIEQRSDIAAKKFLGKLVITIISNIVDYKLSEEFLTTLLVIEIYKDTKQIDELTLNSITKTIKQEISNIIKSYSSSLESFIGNKIFTILKNTYGLYKANQVISGPFQ